MEPKVLFEDDSIIVLDKPAGMIVNKADTTVGERTVQDWVEEYFKILSTKHEIRNKSQTQNLNDQNSFEFRNPNFEFFRRAGIVHRLDKETSGVLVVAKTPEAFEDLQRQFKERIVKKTYLALVHGIVEPEEGEINVPVGRLPWNRMRFGVVAGGRESVTRYRVISNFKFQISNEQMSLIELYPETGRTHQIRVHLKHINHPIFGDSLYAGRKTSRDDRKILPRVFLHASKITFNHPITGEQLTFKSPMPKELQQLTKT